MRLPTGHPVVRTELADRGLPLTRAVCGEPGSFPHRGDPGSQTAGDEGMRERPCRINVDELARCHEPSGGGLGDGPCERAKLGADIRRKLACVDLFGEWRVGRCNRVRLPGVGPSPTSGRGGPPPAVAPLAWRRAAGSLRTRAARA